MEKEFIDLKQLATIVHSILMQYVAIHNKVFKFSLSKIFKPIPFAEYHESIKEQKTNLIKIIGALSTDSNDKSRLAESLLNYSLALYNTLELFEKLLFQLKTKSEAAGKYNLNDYSYDVAAYEESIKIYTAQGDQLNRIFKSDGH